MIIQSLVHKGIDYCHAKATQESYFPYLYKNLLAASFVEHPTAPIIPLPEPDAYHMFRRTDGLLMRRIQQPISSRKFKNVRFSLINILRAMTNKKIFERMVTIWLNNSRHHTIVPTLYMCRVYVATQGCWWVYYILKTFFFSENRLYQNKSCRLQRNLKLNKK